VPGRRASPGPTIAAVRPHDPTTPTRLEGLAFDVLGDSFGTGSDAVAAAAPGRVTLTGEHVDYAGGRVICMAIDLSVGVALRPSADGHWRVADGIRRVERPEPSMRRDIGDRLLACAVALGRRGLEVPPLEIGTATSLAVAAGLGSSAAVMTASLVAILRLLGQRLSPDELVATAVVAERDIVGVPNGDMDQRAVVHGHAGSALALDCATGSRRRVPWPWPEVGILVAASGERHDNAGAGYRRRRAEAGQVLSRLGVGSCQEIGERWRELPAALQPRARHLATETGRSDLAAAALEAGDAPALGRLIDQSHRSLRRDYAVSTDRIDAMVASARGVPGCYGARLVGGGFGGSVIALVEHIAADRCAAAMTGVAGVEGGSWMVHPADGLEVTAADVVSEPPPGR
jgi:galactokinase